MMQNVPILEMSLEKTARRAVLFTLPFLAAAALAAHADYLRQHVAYALNDPPEPPIVADAPPGEPDVLAIPSLGIRAPLRYGTEATESAFQAALRDGVVHYPGTALPGAAGNAYYFGHSSDYPWAKGEYKTVFALLPQIAEGDEIVASDASGTPHRYRVVEKKIVSPRDLTVLDQGDGTRALLTLQTSYPLGTALRRYIVIAELIAN